MSFDLPSVSKKRARTSEFGRDAIKQLQALRRSTGRQKAPRKLYSRELQREASRSRRSRRSNSGRVEKQNTLYQQVTNPRNWYHQDTVQSLMRQLAELNDHASAKHRSSKLQEDLSANNKKNSNMFNLENSTVKHEQPGNVYGKHIKTIKRGQDLPKTKRSGKTAAAIDLIEKHVLRDITRHLMKKKADRDSKSTVLPNPEDLKDIYEEESASGMRVVITKTPKTETHSSSSQFSSINKKHLPPFMNHGMQRARLRKPVKLRSERISLPSLKDKPPTLTAPANIERRPNTKEDEKEVNNVSGSPKKSNGTELSSRQKPSIPMLPQIQEETDSLMSGDIMAHGRSIHMATGGLFPSTVEKSTNTDFHAMFEMISPPEVIAENDNKVKLPILGKSIGRERFSFSEIGDKRSYFREIRKMIHGLYGEYFEPSVEGNFTYENQVSSQYARNHKGKTINYVTPTLEQNDTKAGSYTLQLYQSSQFKHDESSQSMTKSNKMSVPVLRNKYGQSIALSKKRSGKHEVESQTNIEGVKTDHCYNISLPLNNEKNIYKVIQEEYLPRMTPNTPDSGVVDMQPLGLQEQLNHQVSLYRDQVAKEHEFLNGLQAGIDRFSTRAYDSAIFPNIAPENLHYDGVDIDLYLEIKHRKSLERRLRLKELKQRQRNRSKEPENKHANSHLEVVEQRDKFLSQIAHNNSPEKPMTSDTTRTHEMQFDYYHGSHISQTPIANFRQSQQPANSAPQRQGMDTKIYRIFAERKNTKSAAKTEKINLPPTAPTLVNANISNKTGIEPAGSNKKDKPKKVFSRRFTVVNPPISDLVSRFQVATKYKLDREYVKTLASSTN